MAADYFAQHPEVAEGVLPVSELPVSLQSSRGSPHAMFYSTMRQGCHWIAFLFAASEGYRGFTSKSLSVLNRGLAIAYIRYLVNHMLISSL